jgi:hypothetical protein
MASCGNITARTAHVQAVTLTSSPSASRETLEGCHSADYRSATGPCRRDRTLKSHRRTVTSVWRSHAVDSSTHFKPVSDPCQSGKVPLSWLASKPKSLHQPRSQTVNAPKASATTTASTSTHIKRVSEPRAFGMVPLSRLPNKPRYLPCNHDRGQPRSPRAVNVNEQHDASRQVRQRAE